MAFEQKQKELAEEATKLIADAEIKANAGDVEGATLMVAEATKKSAEIKSLETIGADVKRLEGAFNVPLNAVPVTSGEKAKYDPKADDANAKRDASYQGPLWVAGLPAAIQPEWVRKQMGDNLKAEADFYVKAWTEWFRSPNEQAYFHTATSDAVRAMQEGTDTEGGFFVPEEYRTMVIHNVGVPGSVHRPRCTQVTTGLKDGYFPTIGSVQWAKIDEEAAFTDRTPTVGQVAYTIRKSGGKVTVSTELLEDAQNNLPALLQQIFGEAAGRYEDQQLIEGDGTTEPEGLRTSATDGPVTASNSAVVIQDVLDWFYALPAQFRATAAWSTTSSFMAKIGSLNSNRIAFLGDLASTIPDTLLGKPVIESDVTGWDDAATIAASEEVGAFGDFRNYIFIDRVGMSLRRDDSIYVNTDQVWFGARKRFDGRLGIDAAFRILKIAS